MSGPVSVAEQKCWDEIAAGIATELRRYAATCDERDAFAAEGLARLRSAGLLKALVPVDLGGKGAQIGEICSAIRIIAAACGSTALAFSMHSHLVAAAAWRREHQKAPTEGLLKRVAAEDLVLVSSGGSDWLESGGRAERVDGGFNITARKPFASSSPAGDLLVTSAVYDDPDAGPTVLHFAVSLKANGVQRESTWQALGMRGTGSDDIVLNDVFVPDTSISGRRPAGQWHLLFHTISMIAFPIIYSAYMGVAEGARDLALEMLWKRQADGDVAKLVGRMENALLAAELAHERMVRIAETEQPSPETTSQVMACRTLVGQNAIEAVTAAMEAVGGASFYRKTVLERMFRDVQAARFHPLRELKQLEFTGRVALGWDINP